jgi:glycosyltransferase involved in cell wall biosynthesis
MTPPLLSVCLITYNHGNYIREALDGILMQRVNFPLEIIIADDCSKDDTRSIIQEYVDAQPDLFKLVFQKKNVGPARNWMDLLSASNAKYIAYMEGDDYWTDATKLQKQVDFLENNPDYALCFHRSKVFQDGMLQTDPLEERYNRITQRPVSKVDLLQQSNFIQSHSVVFRNVVKEFPVEFNYSPAGDLLFYILVAEHGYIHRFDDVMGVYRMGSGSYSTLDSFNLRRQKLKIEISILSLLSEQSEKEIMLSRIYETLNRMKNPLAEANRFNSLKDVVSMKLMSDIFLHKIKKFFRLNRTNEENAQRK